MMLQRASTPGRQHPNLFPHTVKVSGSVYGKSYPALLRISLTMASPLSPRQHQSRIAPLDGGGDSRPDAPCTEARSAPMSTRSKLLWTLPAFAIALLLSTTALARPQRTPTHYRFWFKVAAKPSYRRNFSAAMIIGRGSGSFSIRNRKIDRRGTVFWDLIDTHGSVTFTFRGHLLVQARIVGGHYGPEKRVGALAHNVVFLLRLTTGMFRCKAPAAQLGLQERPQGTGDPGGMQFHACATDVEWAGMSPALVVRIIAA